MFKNTASQKLIVFAFDATTNLPKTGDAANLTAYVSKDYGAVTVLADTSAAEMDATNAKGYYLFDLAQAETNGDTLLFSGKSSTANIVVVAVPATVFTLPPGFTALGAGGDFVVGNFTITADINFNGTMGINNFGCDVASISGDSTSAAHLASAFNGTGGVTLSLGRLVIDASGLGARAFEITSDSDHTALKIQGGIGIELIGQDGDGLYVTSTGGKDIKLAGSGTISGQGGDPSTGAIVSDGGGGGTVDANIVEVGGSTVIPILTVDGFVQADLQTWKGDAPKDLMADGRVQIGAPIMQGIAYTAVFQMLDTSGVPATGKIPAVKLSIDGADFVAASNTPATELSLGYYKIELTSLGEMLGSVIVLRATAAGCKETTLYLSVFPGRDL